MSYKICHCIISVSGGGAEKQLSIYLNQCKHSFRNYLVFIDSEIKFNSNSYKVKKLNSKNSIDSWLKMWRYFKDLKPDIIHIWAPSGMLHYYIPARVFGEAKIILGVRSAYKLDSIRRFLQLCVFLIEPNVVSNVHLKDHSGSFGKVFHRKRYFYIPNSIHFDSHEKFIDSNNILCVGRLIKDKNHELVIRAMKKLSKSKAINLTIVGSGINKKNLHQVIYKEGLEQVVSIINYSEDIKSYYHTCSIFIHPSLREGMPNVIFEAAVNGCILILSDLPPHKRWFEDRVSAFFFKNDNLESLCNTILEVINTSIITKREIVKKAQKLIKEELGLNKYCDQYKGIYEELFETENK